MTKAKAKTIAVPVAAPIVFKDVMFDLETLGTRADSVILSIGAVKFDSVTGVIDDNAFYQSVSIDSNYERGHRVISEDTLIWWLDQTKEAQKVFTEEKTTLGDMLEEFSNWFDHDDYRVWSNGADFDIPMIAHAMHTFGLQTPWKFFNARCFRTVKSLPIAKHIPKPINKCAHNALQDAVTQAQWLIDIERALAK